MYPYILPDVMGKLAPTYDFLLIFGVFVMILYVIRRLEKGDGYTREQTNRILILLVISLLLALAASYLIDGVFHSIKEGEWAFGSINFLGGLIGGFVAFFILMRYYYKDPNKDMWQITRTIITGVVIAHAIGRVGCFMAGCCYGIPTESYLGVIFPHGESHIHYPGEHVYPTQLFEAGFLFIMFILLNKVEWFKNKEIYTYLIGYGIWRILIEFIRGDNRGAIITLIETEHSSFPTPAQLLSLGMVVLGIFLVFYKNKQEQII